MKKTLQGQKCVYCVSNPASTWDHVFSREFFLKTKRVNLPQVPACETCNGEKAKLEHYLTAVLPFGGRHPDATDNLANMVPKRLAKNAKLHRNLAAGTSKILSKEKAGLILPTTALDIDVNRIEELFRYIVKALTWYHWKFYFTDTHFLDINFLADGGEKMYERFFSGENSNQVSANLGDATFVYRGTQAKDNPEVTAWEFVVYGGLKLTGDPQNPKGVSSKIMAMTGDKKVKERANLRLKFCV